jgi:hypothetical protein
MDRVVNVVKFLNESVDLTVLRRSGDKVKQANLTRFCR